MRVWRIQGWFHDCDAEKPSEHVLTVAAYAIDDGIDLAVAEWNRDRAGIKQVERFNVYGVAMVLHLDAVESESIEEPQPSEEPQP